MGGAHGGWVENENAVTLSHFSLEQSFNNTSQGAGVRKFGELLLLGSQPGPFLGARTRDPVLGCTCLDWSCHYAERGDQGERRRLWLLMPQNLSVLIKIKTFLNKYFLIYYVPLGQFPL